MRLEEGIFGKRLLEKSELELGAGSGQRARGEHGWS